MTSSFILGILGGLGAPALLIILLAVGIGLLPKIFYLITLQNTMNSVSPENRKMSPGQVWLELIPLFNLVWQFFNVINVSDSLKKEFETRGMKPAEDRPGYSIGITFCILFCCSVIPVLGALAAIAGLICWIIFWVKISNYRAELERSRKF
jgi:hypothetical protein